MLAATYDRAGDPDVLQVREVNTPEPGPGEVRVRVAVAGVNPTDWKSLRRADPSAPFAVPCEDGAGTIDAVGAGVEASRIGERVWLVFASHPGPWGAAAQYSIVSADRAIPLPDTADFELGASLGVPALTAWHCLRADGLLDGLSVLVAGGAGAVGQMAIQLARHERAARVIATVSGPEKGAIATHAGAQLTVNYRTEPAAESIRDASPHGIDRFIEVAVDANLGLDIAVAAPHATISVYAADPETVAEVPVRALMGLGITIRFMSLYTVRPADLHAAIDGVSRAVQAGALTTLPLTRFPLTRTADALDAVRAGAVGKVLIDIP